MPELAHTLLAPAEGPAARHLFFLHGILGSRANWRGIARKVIDARPGFGAVLVDLRGHGDSLDASGPDTLEQAADDVASLARALGVGIDGIVGHSFGGKVALAVAHRHGATARTRELFVVDSSPGARELPTDADETLAVIAMLERAPARFADRNAFVAHVRSAGFGERIAQWLAMGLRREADGARAFGPDLARVRRLLESYAALDLFPALDPPPCPTCVIIGARSKAIPPADRDHLFALARTHADLHPYVVEGAGHWVHVDAPETVVALLSAPA